MLNISVQASLISVNAVYFPSDSDIKAKKKSD